MSTIDTPRQSLHVSHREPRAGEAGSISGKRTGPPQIIVLTGSVLLLTVVLALAFLTRDSWLGLASEFYPNSQVTPAAESDTQTAHAHAGQHDENTLELSEQARKNIALEVVTVVPRDFSRTIAVPGVLVDRPGRSEIEVPAPLTGIVTRIYPIRGEAVSPGEPLFDVRLTHEDLVDRQSELLQALEELTVVKREVARLETVTATGAIAGKSLLERLYEQQKLEAAIRAREQALVLHGLSKEQIQSIGDNRRLLQELTILTPPLADCRACDNHEQFLQVAEISAKPGEHITVGTKLCTLTDHCELYIRGKAFEQDAHALNQVTNDDVPVTAIIQHNGSGEREVAGLQILYVENEVELESRALGFYVRLPNELVRNQETSDGHRFIGWRYKPGQRVEVLVPVERWENRIVLPVEAVVREGAERFVYRQNGTRFDRRSVHVEYRDQRLAVIENDGTLFPNDQVAASGAHLIHLALKNKAGSGVDAHAGHNH